MNSSFSTRSAYRRPVSRSRALVRKSVGGTRRTWKVVRVSDYASTMTANEHNVMEVDIVKGACLRRKPLAED